MSIREFREEGWLQEVNRRLLHPAGLALEVTVDDETGEESLSGVWDCRGDPEGVYYGEDIDKDKAKRVDRALFDKAEARETALGFEVQPL